MSSRDTIAYPPPSPKGRSVLWRLLLALTLVAAGLVAPWAARPAAAAEIDPTRVEVKVDPPVVRAGWDETIKIDVSFCVPNTAEAGDTFTLTLPEVLSNWPDSMVLSRAGIPYFNVAISNTSPAVATFVMTEAAAATDNVCAEANFAATASNQGPGSFPLEFAVNGEAIVPNPTPPLEVVVPRYTVPTTPGKNGWAADPSDACRTDPQACIIWNFTTPGGDHGTVRIVDGSGTNWRWACLATDPSVHLFTYDAATGTRSRADGASRVSNFSCTPTEMSVDLDTTGLAANQSLELRVRATATAPGGAAGQQYTNTATVTVGDETTNPGSQWTAAFVGGRVTGDGIVIKKTDAADNDADTADQAVLLTDGTVGLKYHIVNNGSTSLTNITVSDKVTVGGATVSDLVCDFPTRPTGTTDTFWPGPFAPGDDGFFCTATLSGVVGPHANTATVVGFGNGEVTDANDYHAKTETPPTTPPPTTPPTTVPPTTAPPKTPSRSRVVINSGDGADASLAPAIAAALLGSVAMAAGARLFRNGRRPN